MMAQGRVVVVELPEELQAEAISDGGCQRFQRRRRGAVDTISLVIGLGGSAIGLLQAPETVEKFCAWLRRRATRDKIVLQVVTKADGTCEIMIGPDLADPEVEAALRRLTELVSERG